MYAFGQWQQRALGLRQSAQAGGKPAPCARVARLAASPPAANPKDILSSLEDFVTAGPKLRKWYGAGERGGALAEVAAEEEEDEPAATSDHVVVTEADSPVGEQVVLPLILARASLRLVVRDVAAAKTAYGPYATPLAEASAKALRGAKALVVLGRAGGALLDAARAARVGHVIVLSAGSGAQGWSAGARELRDLAQADVAAVRACGVPYSVVVVEGLDTQRRGGGVALAGGGAGPITREGLGALLAALVDAPPARGRTLRAAAGAVPADAKALAAALAALPEDA